MYFFRAYINNILIMKRLEMNELRAKIKSDQIILLCF